MSIKTKTQFDKFANQYLKYSQIQALGAQKLVSLLPKNIGNLIDLGCGNGRIYNELKRADIKFNRFYGIDFAPNMLKLHPKGKNIELINADFNNLEIYKNFNDIDFIVSSSALQWAKNLDGIFKSCSKIAKNVAFFIFTSNSFKTLHKIAKVESPILSEDEILKAFKANFKAKMVKKYQFELKFDNTLEMLRYIKKSGVSGGKRVLSYKEIKSLIYNYPLDYLEFEAVLLIGKVDED